MLYLESIGNPRKFTRLARRTAAVKPVVVVKGARHSGSAPPGHAVPAARIPDTTVSALLRQAGVIRVDTVTELLDAGLLLASQPLPAGPRIAILGNSESLGLLAYDACLTEGLRPLRPRVTWPPPRPRTTSAPRSPTRSRATPATPSSSPPSPGSARGTPPPGERGAASPPPCARPRPRIPRSRWRSSTSRWTTWPRPSPHRRTAPRARRRTGGEAPTRPAPEDAPAAALRPRAPAPPRATYPPSGPPVLCAAPPPPRPPPAPPPSRRTRIPAYPAAERAVRALAEAVRYAAWRREAAEPGRVPEYDDIQEAAAGTDIEQLLDRLAPGVAPGRSVPLPPEDAARPARPLRHPRPPRPARRPTPTPPSAPPPASATRSPSRPPPPTCATAPTSAGSAWTSPSEGELRRTYAELTDFLGSPEELRPVVQAMAPRGVDTVIRAAIDPAAGAVALLRPGRRPLRAARRHRAPPHPGHRPRRRPT